ncbi:hypothetical protein [Microcoleus sp. FACHB-672]|uniref:hypothetical protein n=1 Tax=Microcoleus sp. FACHB-672 TaxID=2692825 RepID=UPI00168482B7|nr:hypothetical protein [Microcoleus sp. FACHB-672]MBD2039684.1 hypothetical protein [Microcoleus sp. FACHB-672]
MFDLGDCVVNLKTDNFGKVMGYGHKMSDNVYTTTLKVLVAESETSGKRGFIEEDLYSAWVTWPKVNSSTTSELTSV